MVGHPDRDWLALEVESDSSVLRGLRMAPKPPNWRIGALLAREGLGRQAVFAAAMPNAPLGSSGATVQPCRRKPDLRVPKRRLEPQRLENPLKSAQQAITAACSASPWN